MKQVSNQFPSVTNAAYKIAIISDAPSKDDEQMNVPFVGTAGNLLSQGLANAQVLKSACFLGYLSSTPAPNYNPFQLTDASWSVKEGKAQLERDLEKFKPNVILILGQRTLHSAGITHPIDSYRGSLFKCREVESPFYNYKCIATYDPREVVKVYKNLPLMVFDIKKTAREGKSPVLSLPERVFELHLSGEEIVMRLDTWPEGHVASIDIEGGIQQCITCMSVATSPHSAFIIDWKNMRDSEKPKVFHAVSRFLRNPRIPKIMQNVLYENMCLPWSHKTPVHGVHWDTMLSGWELFPELPKSLEAQTSIWTDEPYYKFERKVHDDETHNIYCCKDTTVTYEIYEKQKAFLEQQGNEAKLRHFEFNMSLLPAFTYMQLRGFNYDKEKSIELKAKIDLKMLELQGYIDIMNGTPLNINSPKQMKECLYSRMGFEKQYAKEKGRKTTKLTCDTNALLTLLKKYDSDIVYNILQWRALEGKRKQIDCTLDTDGRIRTSYNPVGTDTGRLASYTSNTGSGYNLQTVTKDLRCLFIADPGMDIVQLDLSGADGWTVAAHSAALGDRKMLEDYIHGVKPAKVICAMYLTGNTDLAYFESAEVKPFTDIEIPPWLYAAAKAVQHGTNYGMGVNTMSANILKNSWKYEGNPVHVPPKDCKILQDLYLRRYTGVAKWQAKIKHSLMNTGTLSCASGHIRKFFGRPNDNATIQSAYSHEPQANTTYVTNLALRNLWHDRDNRHQSGKLIIEPLHQVHDAIIVQFPSYLHDQSLKKLRRYFDNKITIAGIELVIPFEGECGKYWGDSSICSV